MHPTGQYEAFAKLHSEEGMSAEDIAARFGVTAAVVRQRLKLVAVSPKLRELHRKGEMNLDQLSAFAITEEHERQERVWSDRILGILAARPPEDLLAERGDQFIDRVETPSRRDEQFRKLLGAVWRNAISEKNWLRIRAVAGHPFKAGDFRTRNLLRCLCCFCFGSFWKFGREFSASKTAVSVPGRNRRPHDGVVGRKICLKETAFSETAAGVCDCAHFRHYVDSIITK